MAYTDGNFLGLPNTFVQAWLAGTVTLSLHSDPNGVIEKYGLGAKVNSISAMKNELEKIVKNVDYWKSMSDNARKFGVENFSIEEITYKLIDVMNSRLAKLIQN